MEVTLVRLLILFLLMMGVSYGGMAQNKPAPESLYKEIARQDSLLFSAFNTRDTTAFKTMLSEDLEFYHDKGGLTGYVHTVESLRKTATQANGMRRDLVAGSMEVYPIPAYGAMQIASHRFCHQEGGRQDCGTFKFVHLWQQTPAGWKLTRVVSYGH